MAIMVLLNIGVTYASTGAFEKAIAYYDKALSIAEKYGFRYQLAKLLLNRAACLANMKRYEQAIPEYEKALALYEELGDVNGKWMVRLNIAVLKQNQGLYEQAAQELNSLISDCGQVAPRDFITRAHLSAVFALQK